MAPSGIAVLVVMDKGAGETVKVRILVATVPALSLTWIVNEKDPGADAIPESVPVELQSERPGTEPDAVQV